MRGQKITKKYSGYFAMFLCLMLLLNSFTLTSVRGESTAGTEQGQDATDENTQTDEPIDGENAEIRTIRVAFPVQEGMSYYHEDGTPDGYNYSYMEKIGEYTGWHIEYVPFDSGDLNENVMDAMDALENGDVDITKSEAAGMNAHITKPIDVEKLKSCMAKLMEE